MTWFLVASQPWTYWIAPLLFVGTLLLLVAVGVGYYRRVSVPGHRWREFECRGDLDERAR